MASQEKIVYQGKIIEVVQQTRKTGDTEKLFEFARRSPGTRLIVRSGDKVLLTKEYRTETGNWDYRLPGGKVFDTLEEYNRFLAICITSKLQNSTSCPNKISRRVKSMNLLISHDGGILLI